MRYAGEKTYLHTPSAPLVLVPLTQVDSAECSECPARAEQVPP